MQTDARQSDAAHVAAIPQIDRNLAAHGLDDGPMPTKPEETEPRPAVT